jgi:dienelactone hydrolase
MIWKKVSLLMFAFLFLASLPTAAQSDVQAEVVQIRAPDGVILTGIFYAQSEKQAPAVLLLHQSGSTHREWNNLINPLLEAGYNVLAIDFRREDSASEARNALTVAVNDVGTWLDWLHEQPSVQTDAIAIGGTSTGADFALIACANDANCQTVFALSPTLADCETTDCSLAISLFGSEAVDELSTGLESAMSDGMSNRSVLLVASQLDQISMGAMRQLIDAARGELGVRIYPGSTHGADFLYVDRKESATTLIMAWLNEHLPIAAA